MRKYNPRYTAYARFHGKTEEEMLAHDKARFPGACMVEFMLWIQNKWREWKKENNLSNQHILSKKNHKKFDEWLFTKPEENMKIEQRVLEIIKEGRTEGNLFYLPERQLERKLYEDVNKVLTDLGGKWKGGKTKAHVFEEEAEPMIKHAIETRQVISRKKELNLFETPAPVAELLVNHAEVFSGMTFLEPSAGRGKIMRAIEDMINPAKIYWCEIDEKNAAKIARDFPNSQRIGGDFLQVDPSGHEVDRVIMNPPFSKNGAGKQTDIEHVEHALKFLKKGGTLVAIMSAAIKFKSNLKTKEFKTLLDDISLLWQTIDLSRDAFKESGTNTNSVILKVIKRD